MELLLLSLQRDIQFESEIIIDIVKEVKRLVGNSDSNSNCFSPNIPMLKD